MIVICRRFCVEESTMSRVKSPVAMKHERGSSADTGLIRVDNVSSNGGSTDDPNITEDERVTFHFYPFPNGKIKGYIYLRFCDHKECRKNEK